MLIVKLITTYFNLFLADRT